MPEMVAFTTLLGRPGDDYQAWLDALGELARLVAESPSGRPGCVVAGLVDVLQARAYRGTERTHLEALAKLLDELELA